MVEKHARNPAGERINLNTARKYYGTFCGLIAEMAEQEKLARLLPELESFPNNAFSGARDDTEKTKSLGLPVLIKTLRAARAEFLEVVRKFRYAQALFQRPVVPPDKSRRGEGQFRNLDALLWYLHTKYPGRFPRYTSWRESDPSLFGAINRLHGGWGNIGDYFYPQPESMVAPMVLMTIYGHFNVEPLRALEQEDVTQISLLMNKHVQVRTAVQPGKERGVPYRRSFPIDDADPASPNSLLSFMGEWTERIRGDAGKYADCVFIVGTSEGEVKAFSTVKHDGRSGDSKWIHHLSGFCKRHDLPDFNLMELRQTALDFAREISNEDIRYVQAVKGGSSQSVLEFHYESDAFEIRAHTAVAAMQANNERYVRTGGKSQHLGAPRTQDLTAATPGFKCADPYDSPTRMAKSNSPTFGHPNSSRPGRG